MAREPEDTTKAKPDDKSGDSALIRELAMLLDETRLTEIETTVNPTSRAPSNAAARGFMPCST